MARASLKHSLEVRVGNEKWMQQLAQLPGAVLGDTDGEACAPSGEVALAELRYDTAFLLQTAILVSGSQVGALLLLRASEYVLRLERIDVPNKAHRGRGFGSAALTLLKVEAQRRGFKRIEGEMAPEGPGLYAALKRFYERNGGTVSSEGKITILL